MSSMMSIKKWRPVAQMPGDRQIHLPDLADAARLSRRARREAVKAAAADASAGWVPRDGATEPEHCRKIDQEYVAVASQLCIKADLAAAELLTTLMIFVEVDEVTVPEPGGVGPNARRQAAEAARFEELKISTYLAWSAWGLARTELIGELKRRDALRQAARATYAAALAARHPHPDRLPPLRGAPDLCLRQAPAEPPVIAELRERLGGRTAAELTEVQA